MFFGRLRLHGALNNVTLHQCTEAYCDKAVCRRNFLVPAVSAAVSPSCTACVTERRSHV